MAEIHASLFDDYPAHELPRWGYDASRALEGIDYFLTACRLGKYAARQALIQEVFAAYRHLIPNFDHEEGEEIPPLRSYILTDGAMARDQFVNTAEDEPLKRWLIFLEVPSFRKECTVWTILRQMMEAQKDRSTLYPFVLIDARYAHNVTRRYSIGKSDYHVHPDDDLERFPSVDLFEATLEMGAIPIWAESQHMRAAIYHALLELRCGNDPIQTFGKGLWTPAL